MKTTTEDIARFADMFAAMGTESRLRIMQLLLSAHPEGLVVGEIQPRTRHFRLDSVPSPRQAQKMKASLK